MDSVLSGSVAGAHSSETPSSILADELAKLQDVKAQLRDDNITYLNNHPEFNRLLDEFVGAILLEKPDDIVKFGEQFFASLSAQDSHKTPSIQTTSVKDAEGGNHLVKNDGPPPLVIAGPSGVGKGTIVNMLISKYPDLFGFSVSHTTRRPRDGEVDGVNYHFIEDAEMQQLIEAGAFLEHAFVHTHYYGTSFEAIEKNQREGKICILDIDVQGVENIKKSDLKCKYLFIAPPSVDELEVRLRKRSSETDQKIKIRLDNARGEIAYGMEEGNFDGVVVNDDLDTAFEEVLDYLSEWYPDCSF